MSIKNIIFDLGGVLVDFNPTRSLNTHFPKEYHQLIRDNTYSSREWLDMDAGYLTSEEAAEKMCARLPAEFHSGVRQMLLDHEGEMPPIEDMNALAIKLHKSGYKLFLLSNCPIWFDEFRPSVPACKYFDGFIISAEYHQAKPDEEIYYTLLRKYGLVESECFFIDDSPANIETAKKLGMKAHCYSDRNINNLLISLKSEGIETTEEN